jgi:hypothetical protein
MVNVAIAESCDGYPELNERADYIRRVLSAFRGEADENDAN